MHGFKCEARDSFAATVAKSLEINQMNKEAIQCELKSCFKEDVLALSKAMEHADLALQAFRFEQVLIVDGGVLGEHLCISLIVDIFSDKLDALTKHELSLVKIFESIQLHSIPVDVVHVERQR